jgi:hypothetical protein
VIHNWVWFEAEEFWICTPATPPLYAWKTKNDAAGRERPRRTEVHPERCNGCAAMVRAEEIPEGDCKVNLNDLVDKGE